MSNIKSDLALFNELVEVLINEEVKNPVAERIDSNELYDAIDLSLNASPMIDADFKSLLKDVLVSNDCSSVACLWWLGGLTPPTAQF